MAKKIDIQAITKLLEQMDHHQIYKLHMAQARATRKQFAGNQLMLDKVDAIIDKIGATYAQACAKDKEVA